MGLVMMIIGIIGIILGIVGLIMTNIFYKKNEKKLLKQIEEDI